MSFKHNFRDSDFAYMRSRNSCGTRSDPRGKHQTRRNLFSLVSCATYTVFLLGLWYLGGHGNLSRLSGAALCITSAALFVYRRLSITNFFLDVCAIALKADLADIASAYKVSLPIERAQFPNFRRGPSGFWVAALDNNNRNQSSQVIGFLGLDFSPSAVSPSCAELRRMFVSVRHRRRGVGSQLIDVALAHARQFSPPLETLEIETSEFQPTAQRLYEKHGFSFAGKRIMRMGPLSSITMLRFRRAIAGDAGEVRKYT
ncbi:N-acetyltransferase domain-containing protein [Mycena venus]|uniref:N-acetyltransferase domain-containing protein n=1 Tax=Mycena venus TaxID=2733690 RepID=A0A8H6XJK1_9AGAR|nr:N-acetyltransferase domain-containing protein [Mycena venus]